MKETCIIADHYTLLDEKLNSKIGYCWKVIVLYVNKCSYNQLPVFMPYIIWTISIRFYQILFIGIERHICGYTDIVEYIKFPSTWCVGREKIYSFGLVLTQKKNNCESKRIHDSKSIAVSEWMRDGKNIQWQNWNFNEIYHTMTIHPTVKYICYAFVVK